MLGLDRPEQALDEARTRALAAARARAELYARSLGMRVVRIVAVSEAGAMPMPPMPMLRMQANDGRRDPDRAGRAGAERQPDGQLRAPIERGRPGGTALFPLMASPVSGCCRAGTG